jgi:DNA-binding CsgD family transcriptional regulator
MGGENPAGDEIMLKKTDSTRAGFQPLLAKTLENALAHRISKEFPRIGGPRICKLCAEMIMEVVNNHIRPRDHVKHGQIVWTAVSKNNPPGMSKKMADTDMVTVVLDASMAEDINSRIERISPNQRRLHKAIRMCRQAYEQGGVLSIYDLAEILSFHDSLISQMLAKYERDTNTLIPRRGTIHDAGNSVSHKRIICYKRYVEGKNADQIARETYHSIEAVDRYLGQFDRIRHCSQQGLNTQEIAHVLNCSVSLVEVYQQIDKELEGKNA